ncbi:hypothetical protein BS329_20950 [Amycolatopsis coloradensis]|uniref:Uncharacterized protein n=1 Tax=Amycolatopsis coloradensis TaxID=76021 RepID=A0A1R0KQX5_9PSEU|nr:hypothetical protein [Amycolatopsis coloradensis]OLZ50090.1 hypothetical protein BS329_20950 [Amycolatopsis coloradensis]
MGSEQSVRYEVPYFPATVVGFALLWLTGLGVTLFSRPLHPLGLLILSGLFVLTVCVGLIKSRYVVRVVAFTETQVRLESRAVAWTVPIVDLRAVRLTHSGDTSSGYQTTSLLLDWRDGYRSVVCDHDPEMGRTLVRVLPAQVVVNEQWNELQEPSTG